MKKRFVFKIDEKIYDVIADGVTKDAEILFKGNSVDNIPRDVQDLLDAQYSQDLLDADAIAYKGLREVEYEKQGLSFNSFVEMLIENDSSAMAQYRATRQAIKNNIPRP